MAGQALDRVRPDALDSSIIATAFCG